MTTGRKTKSKPETNIPLSEADCLPLCLYLANWVLLFEVDGGGYRRKYGLEFVRLFVSAGGTKSTESSQFLQLLTVLRAISPKRYHKNVGVYFALVSLTATLQRCFRGWLLDEHLRPLTDKGLASRLFVDLRTMRQAIKDLLDSGLIQRLPLPQFDPSADDEESDDRSKTQDGKGGRSKRAEKPGKRERAAGVRKHLQGFENVPEALNKSEVTNDQAQRETLSGHSARGQGNVNHQGQAQGQASTSPTSTPPGGQKPGMSQEATMQPGRHSASSDERQPATPPAARVSTGPRILSLRQDGDAATVGSLLPRAVDGLAHGYAVRANDFAAEIFDLLRPPFGQDTRDGVRELGNYRAALLNAIDAGLSPGQMEELLSRARRDAANIGEHAKRYYRNGGSPQAYWRYLFGKHLNARRSPPARAGPAAVESM